MALEVISLRDAASGSTAKILPGLGFNCFSFQPVVAGEAIETLWAAPNFTAGQERPSHSGIPLMFPFAGRLRGTSYVYRDKTYRLEAGDGIGNAIHGFVMGRPWRVTERTDARAVAEFRASTDDRSILDRWPADFQISVSYEVGGACLTSDIKISNPDTRPLPFGFGTHPYFRVPLGKAGKANDCVVTVKASEYWELVEMNPTGRRLPAEGSYALAQGKPFGETKFDDVFTGLTHTNHRVVTTIADPATGRRLEMTFDDQFRECVVYNPPHREAICIEPYTCVPDAFELAARGLETGLRELPPGGTFSTRIEIALK